MQPMRDINSLRKQADRCLQELLGMIDQSTAREIQQHALTDMVRLTGSTQGYLYTLNLTTGTIRCENIASTDPASSLILADGATTEVSVVQDGCWSACLATGQAVIHNTPPDCIPPLAGDLGPLRRDITVPIRERQKTVAVIDVANRPTPYQAAEAELLQEMADGLWRVIVRKRLHDSMPDDVK